VGCGWILVSIPRRSKVRPTSQSPSNRVVLALILEPPALFRAETRPARCRRPPCAHKYFGEGQRPNPSRSSGRSPAQSAPEIHACAAAQSGSRPGARHQCGRRYSSKFANRPRTGRSSHDRCDPAVSLITMARTPTSEATRRAALIANHRLLDRRASHELLKFELLHAPKVGVDYVSPLGGFTGYAIAFRIVMRPISRLGFVRWRETQHFCCKAIWKSSKVFQTLSNRPRTAQPTPNECETTDPGCRRKYRLAVNL
jgi:hypothetical protein